MGRLQPVSVAWLWTFAGAFSLEGPVREGPVSEGSVGSSAFHGDRDDNVPGRQLSQCYYTESMGATDCDATCDGSCDLIMNCESYCDSNCDWGCDSQCDATCLGANLFSINKLPNKWGQNK